MEMPKYPSSAEQSERKILETHLQFCRDFLVYKITGLADELGAKKLGKTNTTAFGIVKHMTGVEQWWFQAVLDGREVEFASTEANPDGDFEVAPGDTGASLLADYRAACAKSDEVCAKYKLGDTAVKARRDGTHPTLAWIYAHMIEETGRHNGHLDIYRELLDGAVDADGF